jgi:GNAT superfamily N-acetyltransferase
MENQSKIPLTQTGLKITTASVVDAGLLAPLAIKIFCDTFDEYNKPEDMDHYVTHEMNQAKLESELAETDNVFFILWYQEIPVGYAKLRTLNPDKNVKALNPIEIERLYVLHQYHNLKLGAALMAHCLHYATLMNHDLVWLGVWEHNFKAIQFYNKWGFTQFGTHPFLLGTDLQTDILMQKALTS